MMKKLQEVPECSAICQVERLTDITTTISSGNDLVFIASKKCNANEHTDTGYISKSVAYTELSSSVYDNLGIDKLTTDIKSLSVDVNNWNYFQQHLSTHAVGSSDIDSPHIISSITIVSSLISSIGTYPLSGGMNTVFKNQDRITINLEGSTKNTTKIHLKNDSGNIDSSILMQNIFNKLSSLYLNEYLEQYIETHGSKCEIISWNRASSGDLINLTFHSNN